MAGAHSGGWCVWQAHIAVAAATGRRTWRWQVEWQLPLPRKDFTLTEKLGIIDIPLTQYNRVIKIGPSLLKQSKHTSQESRTHR